MGKNLILIGMPGAGKSTVGILLAKYTSRDFVDTDVVIQTKTGKSLQEIVDNQGYTVLRQIEEAVLTDLCVENCVVATGGSAVYSEKGMQALAANGIVVFLDVSLGELQRRIHNFTTRGIAKRADQSLGDLFAERFSLYTQYADITIPCDGFDLEDVCQKIMDQLPIVSTSGTPSINL